MQYQLGLISIVRFTRNTPFCNLTWCSVHTCIHHYKTIPWLVNSLLRFHQSFQQFRLMDRLVEVWTDSSQTIQVWCHQAMFVITGLLTSRNCSSWTIHNQLYQQMVLEQVGRSSTIQLLFLYKAVRQFLATTLQAMYSSGCSSSLKKHSERN